MFLEIYRNNTVHYKALEDVWTKDGKVMEFRLARGDRIRYVDEFFRENNDIMMLIFRVGDWEDERARP